MKSPLTVISDPHFHVYKTHATIEGGINSRQLHIETAVVDAVKAGASRGSRILVITGDIFHIRGSLKTTTFNRVFDLFSRIARSGWKIVMIPGNHDMEDFRGGYTAIDTLGEIKGCYVLRGFDGFARLEVDDWKFLGFQYVHKPDEFKEKFVEGHKFFGDIDKDHVILIHQGLSDFDSTGHASQVSCEWLRQNTPGTIVCGHFHGPECNKLDRILQPGAPLQHSFGDEGSDRGCWIVREDQGPEFVPLASPKFITVRTKKDLDQVSGNFVRVQCKTMKTAKALSTEAMNLGALDVTVQVDKEFTTAHEVTVKINSDPKRMLADYMAIFSDKYAGQESKVLSLYEKICL